MKKLLFTIITSLTLFTISISDVKAQGYKNAIGGRFGTANGISFKTALKSNTMLELIGNFGRYDEKDRVKFTGLYEVYNPINGAEGLTWFYGAGGTIGSVKAKGIDSKLYLAANGVLGLDYKFNGAPFNLSLDWIPTLQLTPNTKFETGDVGLGVRFTF